MNKKHITFQWLQLLVLGVAHFLADVFPGLLPVILPAIRQRFGLTLAMGVTVLTVLNFSCNIFQILTGHLRGEKRTPFFLPLGLFSAACICFIAIVPPGNMTFVITVLVILSLVSGFGVAVTHPEGLRGIYALTDIRPTMSTAVFMTGGFLGYASGGWLASELVLHFGLEKLWQFLVPAAVLLALAVIIFKIRLATESDHKDGNIAAGSVRLNFLPIMIMTIPACISSTILSSLIPTRLNELGFQLTFGGFAAMLLGISGTFGSFFWAWQSHKRGEIFCSTVALFLGVPFAIAYLLLIRHHSAVWLLFGTGFFSVAAYPLLVTVSRCAVGLNLGQRMALVVGGSWGIASLVLLVVGWIAEYTGVQSVLYVVPLGYAVSGILGIGIINKQRKIINGLIND